MTYLLSLANSEVLSAIIFAEEVLPSYVRRPVPFVPWSKLRSGTDEYASLHGWPVNEGIEIGSPSHEIVDVKKLKRIADLLEREQIYFEARPQQQ